MKAIFYIFVFLLTCAIGLNQKRIVCYFGSWAIYYKSKGQFEISDINPNLCTHLIYAFIGTAANGTINIFDPYADLPSSRQGGDKDGYNKFNKLRKRNPDLKTLIAVGGWTEGSINFSLMVSSEKTRSAFVNNAVNFVKRHGFNGLDIDWEYPNQRGGVQADKKCFVLLLQKLRETFDKEGLILSVAVGSVKSLASQSYIIPDVIKYVDFINLMTYDLVTPYDNKTGYNAPLYPGNTDTDAERELTVLAAVEYWLKEGAEPEKINLGMPLYGHAFTLTNSTNIKIGAPATEGIPGRYTQEAGDLSYLEICEKQQKDQWKVVYDEIHQVPYAIRNNQWISYDNPRSLEQKVKLLKKYNLGGAMVWSIENDDFRGTCGNKYPLLNTIKRALNTSLN